MKLIFILFIASFVVSTTKAQYLYDYIATYRNQGFSENPRDVLAKNKIIKETIYDFKSQQPNSDSIKKEEFFYDNEGYGFKILRKSYRGSKYDSSGYIYNNLGYLDNITRKDVYNQIFETKYGYDTLTGAHSEYEYDKDKREEIRVETAYTINKKDFTYTKSRFSYDYYERKKNLIDVELFKYNKDWFLTEMEETSYDKVIRKYLFTLDKNNRYIKGVVVSPTEVTYKEEYLFDNKNRIVKIIGTIYNIPVRKEFLYNPDGTIFQEIYIEKGNVRVKKHYYAKLK